MHSKFWNNVYNVMAVYRMEIAQLKKPIMMQDAYLQSLAERKSIGFKACYGHYLNN